MRLPFLYDSTLKKVQPLHPFELSAELQITPPYTLSMTIAEGETVPNVRDWIRYDIAGETIYWRVVEVTHTVNSEYAVTCEHSIVSLADAATPKEAKLSGTLREVLTTLLGYQTGSKRWTLESCPNVSGITVEYSFDEVLGAIVDLCGTYMLQFDQTEYPWKLNVVASSTTPKCEARISRNMAGATITVNDDDLCTRVLCEDLDGGILDLPADDPSRVKYGIIQRVYQRPGIKSATAECQAYLNEHKHPAYEIKLDALLLADLTGESMDEFKLGKSIRIVLPDEVITQRINGITYDDLIETPTKATLTIAQAPKSTVSYKVAKEKGGGGGGGGGGNGTTKIVATSIRATSINGGTVTAGNVVQGRDVVATNTVSAQSFMFRSRAASWMYIQGPDGVYRYFLVGGGVSE